MFYMQNLYGRLFANLIDQIFVWAAVLTFVFFAAFRGAREPGRAETSLDAVSRALLYLGIGASALSLLGIIGASLKLKSIAWFVWGLLWNLTVVAVFWVFPVLILGTLFWGVLGKLAYAYSARSLRLPVLALLTEVLNGGLYF